MFLYLVRHGEAKNEFADPSQALSEQGLRDVQKVASHLARIGTPVDIIFHSDRLRAEQTAAVLSDHLRPGGGVVETDHLGPFDDPSEWEHRLRDRDRNIMLVGHLPYMEKLFSLLMCGFTAEQIITFSNSTIVCLKRGMTGTWVLQWMIDPDVV